MGKMIWVKEKEREQNILRAEENGNNVTLMINNIKNTSQYYFFIYFKVKQCMEEKGKKQAKWFQLEMFIKK